MLKIAVAAGLLAAVPAHAEQPPTLAGTRLDVSVTGMVARAPDVANIAAGVVTTASTASAALAANARQMTATIAALKRAGVADRDIQTASLGLQPQYRYADNQPPVLTGYQASNRVALRLRDIAGAGGVIDALVAAGANQIDGPSFAVDKPDAALDEARTQAIVQARSRADLYARAAGLRVSRIVAIKEEEGGMAAPRPMPMMALAKRDATPIAAGEQSLSVTLTVTFELQGG